MQVENLIIEVRDADLVRIGQFRPHDLVDAKFILRYNNVGAWEMKLPNNHHLGEYLRLPGYGIVVTGPNGDVIFSGPTTGAKLNQTPSDTEGTWVISGTSDDLVLSERLAYPTPTTDDVTQQTTAYDTRSGAAETVIKGYVEANLGASAPASRQVANLTINPDLGRGNTVRALARFDNLQELFYDLAQTGGIGYQLIQVGTELQFDTYLPADKSDTIRMDIANNQLSKTEYSYNSAQVTRAIVGGAGADVDRLFAEVTTTDSTTAETDWNRRVEVFKDDRSTSDNNQLIQTGEELLVDKGKTITNLSVTPSDQAGMTYGSDWNLGDTITVVVDDLEAVAVVTEVGIAIEANGVYLAATVGTPIAQDLESKVIAKQEELDNRVSNLERNTTAGGGSGGLSNPVGYIDWNEGYGADPGATIMGWDAAAETVFLGLNSQVTLQIGQEQLVRVKNDSNTVAIPDMTVVMFTGSTGDTVKVAPAVTDGTYPPEYVVGITTQSIDAEGFGFVTTEGFINHVDTSAWTPGTILWADPSTPGGLTATEPAAPNLKLPLAAVTRQHAQTGRVLVRLHTGEQIDSLHDVQVTSLADGDVLVYTSANGRWENSSLGISNITGLQSALDGKAASVHTHAISDVTNLQSSLDDKVSITDTGLGKTGNVPLVAWTTPAEYANAPVGFSVMLHRISDGMPEVDNYGFFTKIANRDAGNGWGGLWVDHDNPSNAYFGTTSDGTSFATWKKIQMTGSVLDVDTDLAGDNILTYETNDWPILKQLSDRGAIALTSRDDGVYIGNGDVGHEYNATYYNPDAEDIALASDGIVRVFTDLQEGWGTHHTFTFTNTGQFQAPQIQLQGAQVLATPIARNITLSTSAPSGGSSGDIWIQY